MSKIKTAPVDMFITLRSRLLLGPMLRDVKTIQTSILQFGLLSPIIVSRANGRLTVIDGRKRLAAIRRLDFLGRLPRSLVNIPYVELEDIRHSPVQTPVLMSNRDLYTTVTEIFKRTEDVERVAAELFLSRKCVRQILTLVHLSPRLRRAFFDRTIDFDRARAYAAIPNHEEQLRTFMTLGPFAEGQEIIDYVKTPKQAITPLKLAA